MCMSAPKPPPPPPPPPPPVIPPPPPNAVDPAVIAARANMQAAAMSAQGRGGTILTNPLGAGSAYALTNTKTLLNGGP